MTRSSLPPLPSDADLRKLIHFSASDGRIWLAGQRMVLLHAGALATLRQELMESVGPAQTRRFFTRVGFAAGERDAALAREIRSGASLFDMFHVGPQLHMLEGAVQVTPLRFDADPATGAFHCEYRWEHSWEADVHLRTFGPQPEPVCWMLIGYATGYTSAFIGRQILFKETTCVGMHDPHCTIVGKPAEEWPDAGEISSWFKADSLINTIRDLQTEVESLRLEISPDDERTRLVGRSDAFRAAYTLLETAAPTKVAVLLTGETGVGKERFARALHCLSPRAAKPFVAINCAAIPHSLIESELFGAEKGAFTGSQAARAGRFERADGGTLFLDEIGELPLDVQAKLLRVLQEGEVERLGATDSRKVDVRIVAATNRDLEQAVRDGSFRADLYYRINVYPVTIPPLRERQDDIVLLADAMLARFASLHGKPAPKLTDYAYDALRSYRWPGNVRELENLIERAVILSRPNLAVDAKDLFPGVGLPGGATVDRAGQIRPAPTMTIDCGSLLDQLQGGGGLDGLERALLHEAVDRANGNLSAAARLLGLTRAQLSYRLNRKQDQEDA
ncbi:sigma 54-interacting transcriptional regulator [Burkholderia multivorans]|uniref:sigma-54-dependent Fis family transcriptional regulator n=1 Tax=Burkholderia multivorans TaxID=87883 RepID=UPI00209DE239|nr:sigma-54-dependent Fis family transcriptional regulator [Burkholderia multivorans]MCO8609351.1 sigma 54-interacting transcriptional regulator [Burkholderia multivorans]MCO8636009.1 sigma 54-interacting transcriptional regulator [Burkholderia multivorans]